MIKRYEHIDNEHGQKDPLNYEQESPISEKTGELMSAYDIISKAQEVRDLRKQTNEIINDPFASLDYRIAGHSKAEHYEEAQKLKVLKEMMQDINWN